MSSAIEAERDLLRGNCNVCGGPLEKARNALCWYCKRPI
jgi:predicted amidophosphoribosyltransferase